MLGELWSKQTQRSTEMYTFIYHYAENNVCFYFYIYSIASVSGPSSKVNISAQFIFCNLCGAVTTLATYISLFMLLNSYSSPTLTLIWQHNKKSMCLISTKQYIPDSETEVHHVDVKGVSSRRSVHIKGYSSLTNKTQMEIAIDLSKAGST